MNVVIHVNSCSKACPIDAIDKKGNINMNECFYCLDCQSLYYNDYKCPPLVIERKKSNSMYIKNLDKINLLKC